MLEGYFYNERIRKAVAVFGSLFNNIYVVRKNSSGGVLSQVKVPLSYAPKRDFVDRISRTDLGEEQERQIAIKLPRMSFEILAMNYDQQRQLPKLNKRIVPSSASASSGQVVYTPVPYNINFQLNIYARSQDDALQCVEQILPYFTPHYNLQVKPLEGFDLQEDTPIRLDGVVMQDDFEGALETRRTIIYTLDFEMKLNLYKVISSASNLIAQATTNFYDYANTNDLLSYLECNTNIVEGNSGTMTEDGGSVSNTLRVEYTLNSLYDGNNNVIGSPFSIASGDSADYGTTTIVPSSGVWSYTSNPDFYGIDTFDVSVDVGQNVTEKFTITVNVSEVSDVIADSFTLDYSGSETLTMNVASNDLFETAGTITHSIEVQPAQGTVTIIDATAGTFLYTPPDAPFGGVVTWQYRATPDGISQKSEVASVQITVTDTA